MRLHSGAVVSVVAFHQGGLGFESWPLGLHLLPVHA